MATYKNRTTPGVYITELDAFPRSVVGVATAVPAFIGYTEKAELNGKPIFFTPVKISSLADFEQLFGGAYHAIYNIEQVPVLSSSKDNYDFACERLVGSPPEPVLTYYEYSRVDTALSPPTATALDSDPNAVATLAKFNLYNGLRLFYANGGGTCYIVSVGTYYDDGTPRAPVTVSYDRLKKGLDAIKEQSGPTMLVIPDAVLLPPATDQYEPPVNRQFNQLCRDMLQHCHDLQDRVAILDVYGAGTLNQHHAGWQAQMDTLITNFQTGVGDAYLNYGMAYFPFLVTSIIQPGELNFTNFNIGDATQWDQLRGILDDQADLLYPKDPSTVKSYIAEIPDARHLWAKTGDMTAVTRLNQNLVNAIPLLKQMENILAVKMALMPTSAAMAGVYTFTDGTRGVWNAPANVALSSVIAPNVQLNNEQQSALNMPLDGKAINVIRQFVGRGPVVWGARTLDGNSLDWRYIQVRRTLVYVETSIEAALQPFVFAANDGKTWVAVTSMVSNFLQGLWSQGGLMGAKPDEAFTVSCGLGSTMTALDILDGYMIVQVTLQMIRPAEFIELTFKQKMQGVG